MAAIEISVLEKAKIKQKFTTVQKELVELSKLQAKADEKKVGVCDFWLQRETLN